MLGLTVFESVLERLKAEALQAAEDEAEQEDTESSGPDDVRGLPAGFAGLGSGATFVSGSQAQAAYLDLYEEPEPPAPQPPPPAPSPQSSHPHLTRVSLEEVATDLDLKGNETIAQLTSRRRAFARANHPDRAPAELRANATLRMKIANMLIDETIRRINAEINLGFSR